MPNYTDLFHEFDRIRAALLRQECERTKPGFGEWVIRALPHFAKHVEAVDSVPVGTELCSYLDWLDSRKLAFRGEVRWVPSLTGPLVFVPPTMEAVLSAARRAVFDLGLSGRSSLAPTPKILGASGRKKMGRSLVVRKLSSTN